MEKTTTKKWLRTSVLLYIVILTMVAVASFAWFLFEDTVTLHTDDEVIITAGKKLEIARITDGVVGAFGQKVTVTDINVTYPDISGDGMVFWYPKTLDGNDETYNHLLESFDKIDMADPPENYDHYFITINLQFKSDEAVDVYLSNTSYVDGYFDGERQSAYGDFSTDAIAGAVRVAFISYTDDNDTTGKVENIWIPNDKYELKTYTQEEYIAAKGQEEYNKFINDYIVERGEILEFIGEGARENLEDIGYLTSDGANALTEQSWGTEDYGLENPMQNYLNRHVTLGKSGLATGGTDDTPARINNAKPLVSFSEDEVKLGIAKRLTIRIWIEGTDRESSKATAGGKLKYALNFIGIQKDSGAEAYDDIKNTLALNVTTLTYTRESSELPAVNFEYSHNGIDWRPCSSNTIDSTIESGYLYVRVAETVDTKASDWIAVYDIANRQWKYYE